jgi:hypothetical protein
MMASWRAFSRLSMLNGLKSISKKTSFFRKRDSYISSSERRPSLWGFSQVDVE